MLLKNFLHPIINHNFILLLKHEDNWIIYQHLKQQQHVHKEIHYHLSSKLISHQTEVCGYLHSKITLFIWFILYSNYMLLIDQIFIEHN